MIRYVRRINYQLAGIYCIMLKHPLGIPRTFMVLSVMEHSQFMVTRRQYQTFRKNEPTCWVHGLVVAVNSDDAKVRNIRYMDIFITTRKVILHIMRTEQLLLSKKYKFVSDLCSSNCSLGSRSKNVLHNF